MTVTFNHFKIILFFIVSMFTRVFPGYAQMIIPLRENVTIKKHLAEEKIPTKSTRLVNVVNETVTLPFFEDFSNITVFPDPQKWRDRYAFINATYPVEPISYGVATLDAMDDMGNIYTVGDRPVSCDTLTSVAIDLTEFASSQEKIYLSFFYQPQGNGEAPETKDSLVLELYSPKDDKWLWAWSSPGMPLQPFKLKIIQIKDSLFQVGFRFRFRNYVSMSDFDTQSGPGALGNFDLWHIDYVRLNNSPIDEHEIVYDLSLLYPLKSSYKDYHAIPWDHVDSANYNFRSEYIPIVIRTPITLWSYGKSAERETLSIGRGYFIRNVKTGQYILPPFLNVQADTLLEDSVYLREDAFVPEITYDGTDIGIIETGAYLVNVTEDIHINDTVKKTEYFQYHYAYDDGTPERGFGNPGPLGGVGSYIAVYFQIYRTDYLRAIDIYFNRTKNNFTGKLDEAFSVCVWQNNSNQPGELIYESEKLYAPDTTLPFGRFMRIALDSGLFIRDGIYIGIRQYTDEFLNIGYDINTAHKNKIFIRNFGTWDNLANTSNEEGSLMIRPVMSRNPIALGLKDNTIEKIPEVKVSPNPADTYIYYSFENGNHMVTGAAIYDMLGNRTELQFDYSGRLDISHFIPGIYILKLNTSTGKTYSSKFIKSR